MRQKQDLINSMKQESLASQDARYFNAERMSHKEN